MSTTPTAATPATPRRVRRAPQPLPPVSPEAREMISWGAHLLVQALARPEQGTPPLATSVYWALAGISLALAEDPALTRGLRSLGRGDKGTIDLLLALGHAVPGTLKDWVGGDERHRPASGATPPASAGEPVAVPTAACPTTGADEKEITMTTPQTTSPGASEKDYRAVLTDAARVAGRNLAGSADAGDLDHLAYTSYLAVCHLAHVLTDPRGAAVLARLRRVDPEAVDQFAAIGWGQRAAIAAGDVLVDGQDPRLPPSTPQEYTHAALSRALVTWMLALAATPDWRERLTRSEANPSQATADYAYIRATVRWLRDPRPFEERGPVPDRRDFGPLPEALSTGEETGASLATGDAALLVDLLGAQGHDLETPDAAAAASPTPTPATAATSPASPLH